MIDPVYIKSANIIDYFNKKELLVKTTNGDDVSIREVLEQYQRELTLKQIRKVLINNVKEEIILFEQSKEMTVEAVAEHIVDKLLNNLNYFEAYIEQKEEFDCRIV